ncbi:carbamoyltransferase [Thalassoglobus sp.]|uniref:carbamoyltransferase family protein n=1 Tax=Thalassoglobus sp. TaxID=2795869 RepID=UPI003AA9408C
MTAILGISAFYHDSAAALIVDGNIVAAAQEERFTRNKHDASFPEKAIEYCLSEAGISVDELDYVGFYDKPLLKFDRLLQTYLAFAPRGFWSFAHTIPQWLKQKTHLRRELRKGLGGKYRKRFVFSEHHESHAASAFFPSPFDSAAILTIDGVGEWSTVTFGTGNGNRIELTHELRFPHSLGLLYTAMTYYCGFEVNGGEYKLMGLAPYGEPVYADLIRSNLLDMKSDGSFRMNMDYFAYCHGLTMTSKKFHRLFGGSPRRPESELTQREMNLAASIQVVTEELILRMVEHVSQVTGMRNLCLAGGVALNCVANGRIHREGPFENIWIQPAAGDAGGALGTALLIWHQLLKKTREAPTISTQKNSAFGPESQQSEVIEFLKQEQAVYEIEDDEDELCRRVAAFIAEGKVIGWMQGRMEYGPRALGNRSILGDPRNPEMQKRINLKIKFRESFRPFAPAVRLENVHEYFEMEPGQSSPYMLIVTNVQQSKRIEVNSTATGLEKLEQVRSVIPAVTHVDHSARIQTVSAEQNRLFHKLLAEFHQQTNCPVLVNTSFNLRDEPIVCTPQDAYRCFLSTGMDILVMGNVILFREQQHHAEIL